MGKQLDPCGGRRSGIGGQRARDVVARRRRGRATEERVARILNTLPRDGFRVLHNLRYCWGDIDHIVVRRDSVVFVVETKSHDGSLSWDGRRLLLNGTPLRENWIGQVMRGVRWLSRVARLFLRDENWVVGVLVVPNAKVEFRKRVRGVYVVDAGELLRLVEEWRK